jgi:hypothetical protein
MRGPNLTAGDKIAMTTLREQGKSYQEIADAIGKKMPTVQRHFQRHGDPLAIKSDVQPDVQPDTNPPEQESVEKVVVKKKTVGRVSKPPKKKPFHHLTVRKDPEGKPLGTGVAVMTPAASERGDEFGKALPGSRLGKGAIFDIRKGEVRDNPQSNARPTVGKPSESL